MAEKKKFSRIILEQLIKNGITHFYGIPGGAIAPLYDVLYDYKDELTIINVKHETMAVFMAKGYYLTTGKIACVLTTSGPGITNAITGLVSANLDHIPVLLIGGEVPTSKFKKGSLQDGGAFNVIDSLSNMNLHTFQINSISDFQEGLQQLYPTSKLLAPVFMSLPLDISSTEMEDYCYLPIKTRNFDYISEEKIEKLESLIKSAAKGIIFVGSGAKNATNSILKLSEKLGYGIVTTPKAKTLFEENSNNFGVFGFGGHFSAKKILEETDIILFVGTGLSEVATNNWSAVLKKKISIKIDCIKGAHPVYDHSLEFVGNVSEIVRILSWKLSKNNSSAFRNPSNIERFQDEIVNINELHPISIIETLQKNAPDNTIWTSDIGEHLLFAIHYLKSTNNHKFIAGLNFGSMGSGIGMAIGAKLGEQNKVVVSICGDYGFQMFGMELSTCVQYGINVVFAILNDSRMGMVENGLNHTYSRHLDLTSQSVDFVKIAEGLGAIGLHINKIEDFEQYKEIIFNSKKPVVLDIKTQKTKFKNNERINEITSFSYKK